MNKQQIKALALANGFKLKEQPGSQMDLNPYVYDFATALVKQFALEQKIEGAFKFADFLDSNNFSAAIAAKESGFFQLVESFAKQLRKEQDDV